MDLALKFYKTTGSRWIIKMTKIIIRHVVPCIFANTRVELGTEEKMILN